MRRGQRRTYRAAPEAGGPISRPRLSGEAGARTAPEWRNMALRDFDRPRAVHGLGQLLVLGARRVRPRRRGHRGRRSTRARSPTRRSCSPRRVARPRRSSSPANKSPDHARGSRACGLATDPCEHAPMPIGITDEHEALRQAVRRFVETRIPPAVTRAALDADARGRATEFWAALREPGWLGLHVDEANGGAGLRPRRAGRRARGARACRRARSVPPDRARRRGAPGRRRAAADALLADAREWRTHRRGRARRSTSRCSAAAVADVLVVEVDGHVVRARRRRRDAYASCRASTRPAASCRVELDGARRRRPPARDHDASACSRSRQCSFAAEAIGVAQWCVDTAAEYAKARVQFGRPIGQFQGVKHRCADMLARTELARAAVWDAARAVTRYRQRRRRRDRGGAALAFDAAFANGKDCVQTLGGIGFTWEHDAHIYLRRAMTLHQLAGDARRVAHPCGARGDGRRPPLARRPTCRRKPKRCAPSCARSSPRSQDLDAGRTARRGSSPRATSRRRWPRPWGRDAGALELLVDRGGVPRREGRAAGDHGRRVGAAEPHRLRHRGAAGPLDPPDAARRDHSGASCSANRAPAPTSRRCRRARRASTAAGC